MALNQISYSAKYFEESLDTIVTMESKTSIFEGNQKYINLNRVNDQFNGGKTIFIADILLDGFSDYYRAGHGEGNDTTTGFDGSGHNDGYKVGGVSFNWTPYNLRYDRAIQIRIDYADTLENAYPIMADLYGQFVREKAVPEIDATRFACIVQRTNVSLGNRVTETPTEADILKDFQKGSEWLFEHNVDEDDQVIMINPAIDTIIQNSPALSKYITQMDYESERGVTFKLRAFNGKPLIKVPSDRFLSEIEVGDNGYRPTANSKVINYLIASKKAIFPIIKFRNAQMFDRAVVQDYDGFKLNVHVLHDCIIPKNKVVAIYVSLSSTAGTAKSARVDVSLVEGTVQNAFVVDGVYTNPVGIRGQLVMSKTAVALNSVVNVDNTNSFIVNADGTDNVTALTKAYFALIDYTTKKALAVSGEVTLVKHA